MRECNNSKIHISSNFLLSICLLIMLDTLLLVPSLHCNTSLHFTTLHPTTLHYTYRHFTSSHLHFTTLSFGLTHSHFLSFYFPSHHQTRHSAFITSPNREQICKFRVRLKFSVLIASYKHAWLNQGKIPEIRFKAINGNKTKVWHLILASLETETNEWR